MLERMLGRPGERSLAFGNESWSAKSTSRKLERRGCRPECHFQVRPRWVSLSARHLAAASACSCSKKKTLPFLLSRTSLAPVAQLLFRSLREMTFQGRPLIGMCRHHHKVNNSLTLGAHRSTTIASASSPTSTYNLLRLTKAWRPARCKASATDQARGFCHFIRF